MDIRWLAALPPWDWPLEARAVVLEALTGETVSGEDRLLAAEAAGTVAVMDDELAAVLLRIFADPGESEELRGAAAIALGPVLEELWLEGIPGGFDDFVVSAATGARVRKTLRAAYHDPAFPKLVRRRALEASVRFPEDWHAGAVRAAYRDGDPEWLLTAVFAMRFVDGFEEETLAALRHPDDAVRVQAVLAAGAAELEDALPEVSRILRSESDSELLLAALDAIDVLLPDPDQLSDAVAHLVDSEDPEVSEAATDLLTLADATRRDVEDHDPHDGTWH